LSLPPPSQAVIRRLKASVKGSEIQTDPRPANPRHAFPLAPAASTVDAPKSRKFADRPANGESLDLRCFADDFEEHAVIVSSDKIAVKHRTQNPRDHAAHASNPMSTLTALIPISSTA